MKNILTFILLSISLVSCGQEKESSAEKIKIDPSIQKEVESKISESQFGNMSKDLLIYENLLISEYFENDSLTLSTKNQDKKLVFKSFFYTHNDTLTIDGAYGMFGGFGFSIKIKDNQATVYHMLASDEFPTYSMNENDSLKFRIEVPCLNTTLTLSKMPELKDGEIIYGMVEFESGSYYQSGPMVNNEEIEPRKKVRMNMKVYFKSMYLDIEKMK
tara:strand:+ start:48 stop:695 length:648 start_codon:yes stop_codon:yes gene_type:complete